MSELKGNVLNEMTMSCAVVDDVVDENDPMLLLDREFDGGCSRNLAIKK
jgi:hypothetical protein